MRYFGWGASVGWSVVRVMDSLQRGEIGVRRAAEEVSTGGWRRCSAALPEGEAPRT